jgi:hypothetical protein
VKRIYTDGQYWYRIPTSLESPHGTLALFGLDGSEIIVESEVIHKYCLSKEEVEEVLHDSWKSADLYLSAAFTATSRLFSGATFGDKKLRQILQNIAAGDMRALGDLRAQAERIAAEIGGPVGDSITMLPDRLLAGLSTNYGRLKPTRRLGGTGLAAVEASAERLLAEIYNAGGSASILSTQKLQPCDDDYSQIFTSDIQAKIRTHFRNIWAEGIVPRANRSEREIRSVAATVTDIKHQTQIGQMFPRQYAKITPYLLNGPIWVRWWTTRPGETTGMSHEGLIWVSGRWLWLPRTWKALERE